MDGLDDQPLPLQLLDGELQLVDQFRIEQEVFRPDLALILGQKVAQLEVFGDVEILILLRYFDEPSGGA